MKLIYKCRLKVILHDKANLFWTLVFPLLLATFFSISFGSALENSEKFESIPVAIVEGKEANPYFNEMLTGIEKEGLLAIENISSEEAEKLLADNEIIGIYIVDSSVTLIVNNTGITQSILKYILDSYLQVESTINNLIAENPNEFMEKPELIENVIQEIMSGEPVTEATQGNSDYNFYFQNYYALIAMTCLYGSFFGMSAALSVQGNLSPLGARRSVVPTTKTKLALGDLLANMTIAFAIILILLAYMKFALKIDMGDNIAAVILTALLGSFVGVMLGMFIGSLTRMSSGLKEGILIGGVLFLSFLGGMMYPMIRYDIENIFPLFNKINPAALIVDSFYSLDTYGVGGRFWTNIIILTCFGIAFLILSIRFLRRREYESI